MATATFTTWQALYQQMKNTLAEFASGGKFGIAEYTIDIGGNRRQIKYRSFEEFQKGLDYIKVLADRESGVAVGRTYAGNGGRDLW